MSFQETHTRNNTKKVNVDEKKEYKKTNICLKMCYIYTW